MTVEIAEDVVGTNTQRPLPSGWRWVRLGDACEISMGQSPGGASYNSDGFGLPLLNGPTEFGPRHPVAVQWTSQPTKVCVAGDILLCVRGSVGRKNIADRAYCIGRGLAAIRGKSVTASTDYLWFVLDYASAKILAETAGSTFPNLPGEKLASVLIPLPPLEEQQRIAAILREQMEAVERARAAAEAQLAAARALPATYLREVFESDEARAWPRVRLGQILELRKEIIHPRDNPHGQSIFVGLEHIEPATGRRIGSLTIEKSELTGRKPQFRAGDIVYGYLRPYLNKVWIAEFDGLCSVDQYVYAVRSQMADPQFVGWFMRSPTYLALAPIDRTPGQLPRIRTEEVASVEMCLPPLNIQHQQLARIEACMAETERIRTGLEEQLATINALPATLLRRAFTGEI